MPTPQFPAIEDFYASNAPLEQKVATLYDAYIGISRYLTYLLSALDTLNVSRLDAKVIISETITTDKLAAGSVTADKISVNELSAISANLGTITAGSLTTNTFINVGTDARIGNTLYLKEFDGFGKKGIIFSNVAGRTAEIEVQSGDMALRAGGFITLSPGSPMGVIVNGRLSASSLQSTSGRSGTFYVSSTPGGPTDTAITFNYGICV